MKRQFGTIVLLLLLFTLMAFVWFTSATLPVVVAAHFRSSGVADGFMSRSTYVAILLVLIVSAPLLLAILPLVAAGKNGMRLNIPNRDYWLAPERRDHTLAFIRRHGQGFAAMVSIFLAYVHWLVVRANELQPPRLSSTGIAMGLAVFFLSLAIWLVTLFAHFRRRD